MIEWIIVFVVILWLCLISAVLIAFNIVLQNHEDILYELRNDLNTLKFGDKE